MTDLKWQDPPPTSGGPARGDRWESVRAALKQQPGQWALINGDSAGSTTTHWRRDHRWDGFEFTTRSNGNGRRYAIYARYVGEVAS